MSLLKKIKKGREMLRLIRTSGFVQVYQKTEQQQLTNILMNLLHYRHYVDKSREFVLEWTEEQMTQVGLTKKEKKYYRMAEKSMAEDEILMHDDFFELIWEMLVFKTAEKTTKENCIKMYRVINELVLKEWDKVDYSSNY